MLSQSHIRGLLQSLDFSEGTGTTLNDKSGNNNHATVVGGTWTTDRFGRANRAILLDGVDDYIDLGLANYQGDISVIISYKLVALPADLKFLFAWKYGVPSISSPGFAMLFRTGTPNRLDVRIYGDAVNYLSGITNSNYSPATNGQWEIVGHSYGNVGGSGIVAYNGFNSVFRNATLKYAYALNTSWTTGYNAFIGQSLVGGDNKYANIVVDRLMIFNRRLSAHENRKIMDRLRIGDMNK